MDLMRRMEDERNMRLEESDMRRTENARMTRRMEEDRDKSRRME